MEKPNEVKGATVAVALFHRKWLDHIRKTLGSQCTYLSHMTKGEEHFIKANLLNLQGGKDRILYQIKTDPDSMSGEDYSELLTILQERTYEQD